jgi:hypothetical protein
MLRHAPPPREPASLRASAMRRRTLRRAVAVAILAAAAAVGACGEGIDARREGWPSTAVEISVERARTNARLRASIPECRTWPADVTPDSIGPLRAGQTLTELVAACPEHVRGWDRGFAGIPAPAIATRLGGGVVVAVLNDTLPTARVMEVTTADLATPEGLGLGSPLYDLLDELGGGRLAAGPCVLEIVFDARPGVGFLLGWPADELDCDEIDAIADENALDRLPVDTVVRRLSQYGVAPG